MAAVVMANGTPCDAEDSRPRNTARSFSGLGFCPFKAERWVRFPYELLGEEALELKSVVAGWLPNFG